MDRPVVPRCLPDGFVLEDLTIDDMGTGDVIKFFAVYYRGEDVLIIQINVYLERENRDAPSPYRRHWEAVHRESPFALLPELYAVPELYEAVAEPGQYPNHGCRTDDVRIPRRAYCYDTIHSKLF